MADSDESHSDGHVDVNPMMVPESSVKKVRGCTTMASLAARRRQQRERVHVEFDADMNPIGDEQARFISYLGYLARSRVSILYPGWRYVPQETRAMIWQEILVCNFQHQVI